MTLNNIELNNCTKCNHHESQHICRWDKCKIKDCDCASGEYKKICFMTLPYKDGFEQEKHTIEFILDEQYDTDKHNLLHNRDILIKNFYRNNAV